MVVTSRNVEALKAWEEAFEGRCRVMEMDVGEADLEAKVADAMGADRAKFAKFFHACLEGGVYFAPSQFEAGFLCTAHGTADLERACDVAKRALRSQ